MAHSIIVYDQQQQQHEQQQKVQAQPYES